MSRAGTPKAELRRLKKQAQQIGARIAEIEEVENEKASRPNVGRYFRGTNNYSCPESEADYWPWYFKCTGFEGRWNTGFHFERDKDGRCRTNDLNHIIIESHGLTEITRDEYEAAWADFLAKLTADEKAVTPSDYRGRVA